MFKYHIYLDQLDFFFHFWRNRCFQGELKTTWFALGQDLRGSFNSPFPIWPEPLYQNEAWCTTIHMKMRLICMWMKSHFHIKGRAPRLGLRKRLKVTGKWPTYMQWALRVFSQHPAWFIAPVNPQKEWFIVFMKWLWKTFVKERKIIVFS